MPAVANAYLHRSGCHGQFLQLLTLRPHPAQARQAAEAALREQQGNEARERAALRTILDSKMRNLLSDLARGLAELPTGVRSCPLVAFTSAREALHLSPGMRASPAS